MPWLRDSPEELARIAALDPAAAIEVARDGTVLRANEPARRLLARMSVREGGALPASWASLVSAVREGVTAAPVEVEVGDEVFAFVVVQPRDGEGLHLFGHDVTHARRVRVRVEQSLAGLRLLAEAARSAVVTMDGDALIDSWNGAAERIFGWRSDEVLGKPVTVLMPERFHDLHRRGLARFGRTGERGVVGREVEMAGQRRDGTEFPMDIVVSGWQVDGRNCFGALIRDTSERRAAEDEGKRTRSLLQGTLDSTADGIVVVDDDGRIVHFNQRFLGMWSVPEETLAEIDEEGALSKHVLKGPGQFILRPSDIEGDAHADTLDELELRDGRHFERFSTVPRADGLPVGRVWSFRDVTERVRAEADRTKLLAEEREARSAAEAAERRVTFLLRVAGVLQPSESDIVARLARLARIAVPVLGDWCIVSLVDGEGVARPVAGAHGDPSREALVWKIIKPGAASTPEAQQVVRTGRTALYPDIDPAVVVDNLKGVMRDLGCEARLIVPLLGRARALGCITFVASDASRRFGPEDLELAEDVARRTALAIENSRLFEAERATRAEAEAGRARLELLARVSAELAATLDPVAVLEVIARDAVPVVGDAAAAATLDEAGSLGAWGVAGPDLRAVLHLLVSTVGVPSEVLTIAAAAQAPSSSRGSSASIAVSSRPESLPPDSPRAPSAPPTSSRGSSSGRPAVDDPHRAAMARVRAGLEALGLSALTVVALRARERAIGVLAVARRDAGHGDDASLVAAYAGRAALALSNARLYESEQRARVAAEGAADRLRRLYAITAALSRARTFADVARSIVSESVSALGACGASVVVPTAAGLEMAAAWPVPVDGVLTEWRAAAVAFSPDAEPRFPTAAVIRSSEPVWLESLDEARARFPALAEAASAMSDAAWAVLPLLDGDTALGALLLTFPEAQTFAAADRAFMLGVAAQCAQALARARS